MKKVERDLRQIVKIIIIIIYRIINEYRNAKETYWSLSLMINKNLLYEIFQDIQQPSYVSRGVFHFTAF